MQHWLRIAESVWVYVSLKFSELNYVLLEILKAS